MQIRCLNRPPDCSLSAVRGFALCFLSVVMKLSVLNIWGKFAQAVELKDNTVVEKNNDGNCSEVALRLCLNRICPHTLKYKF